MKLLQCYITFFEKGTAHMFSGKGGAFPPYWKAKLEILFSRKSAKNSQIGAKGQCVCIVTLGCDR